MYQVDKSHPLKAIYFLLEMGQKCFSTIVSAFVSQILTQANNLTPILRYWDQNCENDFFYKRCCSKNKKSSNKYKHLSPRGQPQKLARRKHLAGSSMQLSSMLGRAHGSFSKVKFTDNARIPKHVYPSPILDISSKVRIHSIFTKILVPEKKIFILDKIIFEACIPVLGT